MTSRKFSPAGQRREIANPMQPSTCLRCNISIEQLQTENGNL
jgi:hypothetical protein